MTIPRLVELLSNKLNTLKNQLNLASSVGDVNQVLDLESEITNTEASINQLKTLI